MFRALVALFLGAALLMGANPSLAQIPAGTAEELMRASGMWKQLAEIAPQVRAGILDAASRSGSNPSPAEMERLVKLVDAAYSADRLRSVGVATLKAETKVKHTPSLRQWYASKLGKAITQLEEAASTEHTDPQAILKQGSALMAQMPAERRAQLEELVMVTRYAETMAHLAGDVAVAVQRGANSVNPKAPGLSVEELRSAVEAQRPHMVRAFTALSLANFALVYQSLPASDLTRYVQFLSSTAGRHFVDVSLRALAAGLVAGSTELGRGLLGTKDQANT